MMCNVQIRTSAYTSPAASSLLTYNILIFASHEPGCIRPPETIEARKRYGVLENSSEYNPVGQPEDASHFVISNEAFVAAEYRRVNLN